MGTSTESESESLKQQVIRQLPWLFEELGFRVVDQDFDPMSFGDSFVTLQSADLRVRFVRDRGQISAEVAAIRDPSNWWHLGDVCGVISGQRVEPGFELAGVALLLRERFPAVIEYLGPRYIETKRALERVADDRKQSLLRRLGLRR